MDDPRSHNRQENAREGDNGSKANELVHNVDAVPSGKSAEAPKDQSNPSEQPPRPSELSVALFDFRRAAREYVRNYLNAPREKSKWTDGAMVLLTLLIAVAAFWSAWIFQGQLSEAHRATEIQERPWLSVEVTPVNGVTFVNGQQAVLVLKFSLKNVGHSIAKGVQIDVKMLPTSPGFPVATDAMQHQRELCDHPEIVSIGRFDLFPVEQPVERELDISATPSAGQLARVTAGGNIRNFVGFYFVGCVTYHSSFGNEIRQTYFAYHLIKSIGPENGKFLMMANGMPLIMGFEMGANVPNSDMSMTQELFARNDAY